MSKKIFTAVTIFVFICGSVLFAKAYVQRFKILLKFSPDKWSKIVNGEEAWPDEFFPLSSWTEEDRESLPADYFKKLEKDERKWPEFINRQIKIFKKEYGLGVKNIYDLFLKEQAAIQKPDYNICESPVIAKKTLKRLVDMAYLPSDNFTLLQNVPLESIRILSYKNGKIRIIPFDIIEFTNENQVVLPFGPEANPEEGDNLFNNNDKLFFMIVDAGHRVSKEYIKNTYPGIQVLHELEISYKRDKEKGWVYVTSFISDIPDKSPIDYIELYPETGILFSPFTLLQFKCSPRKDDSTKTIGTFDICSRLISPTIGGIPLDVHDGLDLAMKIKPILFGSIRRSKEDLDMRYKAWYVGNVVTYQRTVLDVDTPFGICTPIICLDAVTFPFTLIAQASWGLPFNPDLVLKRIDFYIGEKLNNKVLLSGELNGTAARCFMPKNKEGVIINCVMSEKEKKWDTSVQPWYVVTDGLSAAFFFRFNIGESVKKMIDLEVQWKDTKENIGSLGGAASIKELKTINGFSFIEGHVVPHFYKSSQGKYNWDKVDLLSKRLDKPLTYDIDQKRKIKLKPYIHEPNLRAAKEKYKL